MRTPTRVLPTSTITPSQAPAKARHIGAIVGGTVGGAAVLLVVSGVAWLCLRKRKSSPSSTVGYNTDQKHSVIGSPHPANIPPHNEPDSLRYPSPYSTPPPVPPESPYHHPAHGQPPMPYYPPPGQPNYPASGQSPTSLYPPDAVRTQAHEMPTARSPELT